MILVALAVAGGTVLTSLVSFVCGYKAGHEAGWESATQLARRVELGKRDGLLQ